MNAYTSKDITSYHASLPSNRFELFANVFSEMVFRPAFREFFPERSVIAEERRSGVDNDPDGLMSERILASSYDGGPYSWSTIGYASDVMGLTVEDARRFHAKHYVPGNMTGVLVGDITPAEAKPILEKTFGRFQAGPVHPAPDKKASARRGISERFPFEAEPSVALAWVKPTLPDPSEYSFDLIKSVLCDGRSSRLRKRLVYDKKLADEIYCSDGYPGSRMENLFLIWIDPMKSVSPKAIADEVADELRKLREEPVGEEELASVKKQFISSFIFHLDDNIDLANSLAEYQAIFGDWKLLADYPAMISAVTPQQIIETARRYLTDEARVVVERYRGKR
ncbi:MAG TPA: pitrilysin family protein, partial [bacterium]|nr:pitrilysin family protein [bacterium]